MRSRVAVKLMRSTSARRGCQRDICGVSSSGGGAGTAISNLVWDRSDLGLEERVLSGGPVKLLNAMAGWDLSAHHLTALQRLSDRQVEVEASINGGDYRDLYRDVPVAGRGFHADVSLPLGQLLEHISSTENSEDEEGKAPELLLYLAQKDVSQVLPELAITPSQLPLKAASARLFQQSLWLGPKGTRTPLHRDPYLNLFCQVWGRKLVRVYPPEAREALHPFPRGVLRNTSQVDTWAVDGAAFPGFRETDWQETVVGPGEVLYMPRGWWHEVVALQGSLSLSFWWT